METDKDTQMENGKKIKTPTKNMQTEKEEKTQAANGNTKTRQELGTSVA